MKKVFKNYNRSISAERRSTLKNLTIKENSIKKQSNANNSLSRIRVDKSNNHTEENDRIKNDNLQINKENIISIHPKYFDFKTSDIDILLKKTFYTLTQSGSLISSKFQNFIKKTLKIEKINIINIEIIYKKMSNKKGFLDYYGFVYSLKEISKKLYSKDFLNNEEYLKKLISEYFSENEFFKTLLSSKSIVFHILENTEFKTLLKNNIKILWTVYLKFFPLLNDDKKYILQNKYSSNKELSKSLGKRRSSLNNFKYEAEHSVVNLEKLNEIKEIANSKSFIFNNPRKNSLSSKQNKNDNLKSDDNYLTKMSKYEKRNSLSNKVDIKSIDDNYGKLEANDINKNVCNYEIDFNIEKEIKLCYIEMINSLKLVPDCFSLKKGLELFSKISMDNFEYADEICEFIINSLKSKEEKIEEISHNSSYSFSGLKLDNEQSDKNMYFNVNYNTPFSFYTFLTSIFYFSYKSESKFN